LGSAAAVLEARLPFSMEPKIPVEVTASDRIDVPVTIANDTEATRPITVRLQQRGLDLLQGNEQERLTLEANQRARRLYRLKPSLFAGEALLKFDGRSEPFFADTVQRSLNVVPDGFPVVGSRSDTLQKTADHNILLPEQWFKGTL